MSTHTGSPRPNESSGLGACFAALTRVFAASLGLAAMLLVATLAGASPAFAHAQLQDISPADGSTLQVPPDAVRLTFDAPPLSKGAEVVAIGSHGTTTLNPVAEGNQIVAAWPAELGPGSYQVNWRAVSGDGHPVQGTTAFRIIGGAASSVPSTAGPGQGSGPSGPTPSASAAAPTEAPSGAPTGQATQESSDDGGGVPWLGLGAAVLTLALLGFGVGSVLRSRRSG